MRALMALRPSTSIDTDRDFVPPSGQRLFDAAGARAVRRHEGGALIQVKGSVTVA
jgi:hypothetical protein